MPIHSIEELKAALREGMFDSLIGTPEGSWIDFKTSPYLDDTRGKWELCKDVAAFANGAGGFIVVGVKAMKSETANTERAVELSPFPESLVSAEKYRMAVFNGIFPMPTGVTFTPYKCNGLIVLAIEIPRQSEIGKPHIVYRSSDVYDGEALTAIGWPVRVDDTNQWMRHEAVHSLLNAGRALRHNLERAEPAKLERVTPSDTEGRIRELLKDAGQAADAWLAIQIRPLRTIDLTCRMFGSGGIAEGLAQRKPLRRIGFTVASSGSPLDRGDRRLESLGRWPLTIDDSGLIVFAASASRLTWALEKERIINAVTLIELTNDLLRVFYEIVVKRSRENYETWAYDLLAHGLKSAGLRMAQQWPHDADDEELRGASSDSFSKTLTPSGTPGADTFRFLEYFYALFGLGEDSIPYCKEHSFSEDAFLAAVVSSRS